MLEFSSTESCTTSTTSSPLVGFSSNTSSCDSNVALMNDFESTEGCSSQGPQGPEGFSAYQIAVFDGFVGTETQWLASLVGPGVPVGGTAGQILSKINSTNYNTQWINNTDLVGLTSVGISLPTGLTVSNSPLVANGVLNVAYQSGYSIPTNSSQTNWDTAYSNRISSLTTTGSNGSATLISNVLNIPTYTLSGLGGVATTTTITTTVPLTGGGDLSVNRIISIDLANSTQSGYLSSIDWNTFNSKFNLPTLTSGSVLFSNGTTIAQDNSNLFFDNINKRLGIGTTTPVSKLHVAIAPTASANYGTLSIGGGAFNGSTSGYFIGSALGTSLAINEVSGYTGDLLNFQIAGVGLLKLNSYASGGQLSILGSGGTISLQSNNGSGFPGINAGSIYIGGGNGGMVYGRTYPTSGFYTNVSLATNGLTVLNANFVGALGNSTGTPAAGTVRAIIANGTDITASNLYLVGGLATGAGTTGDVVIRGANVGITGTTLATELDRVTFKSNGNVGIGTTTPQQTLDVFSTINYQNILVRGNVAPSIGFVQSSGTTPTWKIGISGNYGSNLAISSGATNTDLITFGTIGVGLGITNALAKLHIKGDGVNSNFRAEKSNGTFQAFMNDNGVYLNKTFITNFDGNGNYAVYLNSTGAGLFNIVNDTYYGGYPSMFNQGGGGFSFAESAEQILGNQDFHIKFQKIFRNTNLSVAQNQNYKFLNNVYTINNTLTSTGTATGIFLNATETALNGMVHNLMDLQVGGVSAFRVSKFGELFLGGYFKAAQSSSIGWAGTRSQMYSPSDGVITLNNNASTDFGRLQLGGTTNLFPAIKRNGVGIDFRLADDSGFCGISASLFTQGAGDFSTIISATNFSIYTGGGIITYNGNSKFTNGLAAGTQNLQSSAILQGDSTTKGFLPPRMTNAQRLAILTPAVGLIVYCTDVVEGVYVNKSTGWTFIA
jgi:hypothetical protein